MGSPVMLQGYPKHTDARHGCGWVLGSLAPLAQSNILSTSLFSAQVA